MKFQVYFGTKYATVQCTGASHVYIEFVVKI
jgi:hypothetical protein